MTIGIDASRAFREQRTGVEEYAYQLLEAMKDTTPPGVTVRLYIPKSYQLLVTSYQLPPRWEFRVLRGPSRLWTHTALAWELWRHPPDVFFQPSHVLPVTSYQLRVTRCVLTIHDVGFRRIPWAYSWFDQWYQHTMMKSVVRSQKSEVRVIVPSDFTKNELIELYAVDPKRITVIPHASVESVALSKLSFDNQVDACGAPYILSIGRIEKKKNTAGMLQWYEQEIRNPQSAIRKCHYILIGPDGYGADEVYTYLEKRPALQARVHILGYVPEHKKQQLLQGAQALLHLSHYEGFGLPIAEARAAGVPVIMSARSQDLGFKLARTWNDVAADTWHTLLG